MSRGVVPVTVTRAGILGTLGVLVVALVCVRLGFWQLDRRDQKRTLNRAVAERASLPPLPLSAPVSDTVGLLLRQVVIQGEYDNDATVVLAGYSHRGLPGVHLLTPLRLAGGWGTVLVNRGWVPSPDASTVQLSDYRHAGAVTLLALMRAFPDVEDRVARRASERTGGAVPANAATSASPARADDSAGAPGAASGDRREVWYQLDLAALRPQYPYPILDFYVQALPDGSSAGPPLALPIPVLDEGSHFSYAVQWFSFATIFIIGWLVLLARRGSSTTLRAPPLPARGTTAPDGRARSPDRPDDGSAASSPVPERR